jgi:hypothetical protein
MYPEGLHHILKNRRSESSLLRLEMLVEISVTPNFVLMFTIPDNLVPSKLHCNVYS